MSREAALWSAPLGVAVTHSLSVGSRSGCRAELWAVMGGTLEPESREGKRVALCWNRAAPSTGQLGRDVVFLCVRITRDVTGVPASVPVSFYR